MKTKNFTTRRGKVLPMTQLGLGSAPLGDLYAKLDERVSFETVIQARTRGVGVFDTSPHYGNGLAEARFGIGLRGAGRDTYVLSTKVGRVMDPFTQPAPPRSDVTSPGFAGGFPHAARFDYSYDGAMRSVEQSLLRLGTHRIDVLLIHDVDVWTHGSAVDQRFAEAMGGAYKALDRLRSEGTVAAIGIGVNEAEMCARFAAEGDFDLMMLAGRYTLLEQDALDTFLRTAVERGIGILSAGVFNSGILATGAVPGAKYNYSPAPDSVLQRVRAIERICQAHGVALPAAAMAFTAAHPAVACVVLGAVTPQEVDAQVALSAASIPAAFWADLRAGKLLRADAPVPQA
jgi:D-threo-aldose 1-dehydrogenase